MEITVNNANDLFSEMFWRFRTAGVPTDTRNGPALRIPEPVLTRVIYPEQRVLFHAGRDANPVFHLMESIWMLAGRRDVKFLAQFNSRIEQYSDDGRVFNAAYGFRMRQAFRTDQLISAVELLRRDPETRRCVVQLWDPADLTNQTSKDLACNTSLMFSVNADGALDLMVTCRSNDAWFGYAGANIVHFTFIQEFVARALGRAVGKYYTVTVNLHLYTELYSASKYISVPPQLDTYDYYTELFITPSSIMENDDYRGFLNDCETFCNDPFNTSARYAHRFFRAVAVPAAMVSHSRRQLMSSGAEWADMIEARDWRIAVLEWIERRQQTNPLKSLPQ